MTDKTDNKNITENNEEGKLPKRNGKGQFLPGVSGNPKGKPRKAKYSADDVHEVCQRMDCDPLEILCMIAKGDSEALDAPYQRDKNGKVLTHPMSGRWLHEPVPLKMRKESAIELLEYMAGKIKAVDGYVDKDDEKNAKDGKNGNNVVLVLPGGTSRDPQAGQVIQGEATQEHINAILNGDSLEDD